MPRRARRDAAVLLPLLACVEGLEHLTGYVKIGLGGTVCRSTAEPDCMEHQLTPEHCARECDLEGTNCAGFVSRTSYPSCCLYETCQFNVDAPNASQANLVFKKRAGNNIYESQADSHVDWLIPAILAGMIGMLMVVMVVRERRGGRRRDQPLEETVATPNGVSTFKPHAGWLEDPQNHDDMVSERQKTEAENRKVALLRQTSDAAAWHHRDGMDHAAQSAEPTKASKQKNSKIKTGVEMSNPMFDDTTASSDENEGEDKDISIDDVGKSQKFV